MQENVGLNSLEISKQFIHNTKGYETILKAFKEKKNHDYKKFSNHLTSILKADKASFESSTVTLSKICTKMQAANISVYQGSSILGGFIKYWQQACSIKLNDLVEFILNKWSDFDTLLIYENLLDFIRKIALKQAKFQQLQKSLKKMCYNILQDIDPGVESQKILYIIKYGDLYDDFSKQFILQKVVTCKYQSIKFFYNVLPDTVSKNEIQKLIDYLKKQYIDYTLETRREKEMDAAIKDWKIDVKGNSKIVENGYRKYLRYVLNNNSLFFIQDLLLNYPDVIEILVDILSENRRKYKEALHFINKYGVKTKLKGKIIDELCNSREKFNKLELQNFQMKNILFENDCFGPTQLSVLGQPDKKYLMLPQFGIQEADVIFVDDNNFASIGFEELKKSKVIGLDCQSVSAKYKNGQQFVSIAQLSTLKRVFIYDLVKLKNKQQFLNEIVELFNTYQGSFVGHSVKTDIKELFDQIKRHSKINFLKLNILDTLQIYEAKFRKKEKLCNICSQLCGFSMSKYQQCSGWGNRPLRKAQLHYAALDAFLPIKIVQTLLTTKFD